MLKIQQNHLIFLPKYIKIEMVERGLPATNDYTIYIRMAYVISDACISCGACEGTCPAGAISEGDGQYVIDADTCMECGACADGCPAGAISQE